MSALPPRARTPAPLAALAALAACGGAQSSAPANGPAPAGAPAANTARAPASPLLPPPPPDDASPPPRWPAVVPALGARVADPGDGREWLLTTRIDARAVTVTAAAPNGLVAVVLRHPRRDRPPCDAQLGQLFHAENLEPFRAPAPVVLAGAPWTPGAYAFRNATYEAEIGCVHAAEVDWLAQVVVPRRATELLATAEPLARALAVGMAAPGVRDDYPVRLAASGLVLDDPGDDAPWLYTGLATELPLPSDAVSARAGEPGGVTLTVARRAGSCAEAWNAMRRGFADEGEVTDRPGYVPAAFGPRIRRVTIGARLREIYCAAAAGQAVMLTAVFLGSDGDAMARMTPFLQAVVAAAARPAPP